MKNILTIGHKSNLTISLWRSRHLVTIVLWIVFVGWAVWQHAQQSDQPPIYDAATYYQKAHDFWDKVHLQKIFNPLNVEPSFRPPGTIFMSYPFGFNTDYRGFYFRSVFFPTALLVLAVFVAGYRRDLNSNRKWYLVLSAAFFSTLPAFYYFEVSPEFPAPSHWGLVDNFMGGVAALAAAAVIRSVSDRSLAWLCFTAILASMCVLIKPTGLIVMLLIGVIWFGLSILRLKTNWYLLEDKKNTIRWLFSGSIIFGIPYSVVVAASFLSNYLSKQNLAFGNGAILIMHNELKLTWEAFNFGIRTGLGYPFVAWLLLTILLFAKNSWQTSTHSGAIDRLQQYGWTLASCITFIFGIWFWLFGSGGVYQIRYFIPFALMAVIFTIPVILPLIQEIRPWKMAALFFFMALPITNMGALLAIKSPSISWQKWTGVNLTSDGADGVVEQAKQFVANLPTDGSDVVVYSMSMNVVDAQFQAVYDYSQITAPRKSILSTTRPIDWQRPTTFRTEEMLRADYWLFEPVRDPHAVNAALATSTIDTIDSERLLFQAWASQLTTNEGVTVVSESPMARILRIDNAKVLESALDVLVANHHWRNVFTEANKKWKVTEKELMTVLEKTPAILENINFADTFQLRALTVSRTGNETIVRIWWKPLAAINKQDWAFFIHSIDDEGKILQDNYVALSFNGSPSSLDERVLFKKIAFKGPSGNGTHRLAVGVVRPGQPPLTADKGIRDWNNSRVIVPLP